MLQHCEPWPQSSKMSGFSSARPVLRRRAAHCVRRVVDLKPTGLSESARDGTHASTRGPPATGTSAMRRQQEPPAVAIRRDSASTLWVYPKRQRGCELVSKPSAGYRRAAALELGHEASGARTHCTAAQGGGERDPGHDREPRPALALAQRQPGRGPRRAGAPCIARTHCRRHASTQRRSADVANRRPLRARRPATLEPGAAGSRSRTVATGPPGNRQPPSSLPRRGLRRSRAPSRRSPTGRPRAAARPRPAGSPACRRRRRRRWPSTTLDDASSCRRPPTPLGRPPTAPRRWAEGSGGT